MDTAGPLPREGTRPRSRTRTSSRDGDPGRYAVPALQLSARGCEQTLRPASSLPPEGRMALGPGWRPLCAWSCCADHQDEGDEGLSRRPGPPGRTPGLPALFFRTASAWLQTRGTERDPGFLRKAPQLAAPSVLRGSGGGGDRACSPVKATAPRRPRCGAGDSSIPSIHGSVYTAHLLCACNAHTGLALRLGPQGSARQGRCAVLRGCQDGPPPPTRSLFMAFQAELRSPGVLGEASG